MTKQGDDLPAQMRIGVVTAGVTATINKKDHRLRALAASFLMDLLLASRCALRSDADSVSPATWTCVRGSSQVQINTCAPSALCQLTGVTSAGAGCISSQATCGIR